MSSIRGAMAVAAPASSMAALAARAASSTGESAA